MSTISIRLPDSLHDAVREVVKKDRTSINQFIATALAEKLSALKTVDYLKERARQGSKKKFEDIMLSVPDVEPEEYDKL